MILRVVRFGQDFDVNANLAPEAQWLLAPRFSVGETEVEAPVP